LQKDNLLKVQRVLFEWELPVSKIPMRVLLFLFCLLASVVGKAQLTEADALVVSRIRYVFELKNVLGKNIWPDFNAPRFDVPLVYYTDSNCFVANPSTKFLGIFKSALVAQSTRLKIYKTNLLDSARFHMETGVELTPDDTALYNYRSPFMNCSSFEITHRTILDVDFTEQWVAMILHEYFHGFQFQHKPFLDYFSSHMAYFKGDSLTRIYKSNPWFQESVDTENALLLSALKVPSNKRVKPLLDSFFQLRTRRRTRAKAELDFDIQPYEEGYETLEGTARYVEWRLYALFAGKTPSAELHRLDTAYGSYSYFRNYTIAKDPWLYETGKTAYYYAIGFNIARLLDQLGIDYKSRLFREGGLSLEEILKEGIEKK
jgi:hypothetical protein